MIAEMPGRVEDQIGRPFAGASGKYLRTLVKQHWSGPVAFDNAVRCFPAAKEVKNKHIDKCRGYGAKIIKDAEPKRIICLGSAAVYAVLGRRPPILSVRTGYGWYKNPKGKLIPVFFAVNPAAALRNTFVRKDFEKDIKNALTCEIPKPKFDGITNIIETEEDALQAKKELLSHRWITYDIETSGLPYNPDFKIEACTLLGSESSTAWTWGRTALKSRKCRKILKYVLEKAKGVTTQNGKYDDQGVQIDIKADVQNIYMDTRLGHKLMHPDTDARLEVLSELIGMGGHKLECEHKIDEISKELKRLAFPKSEFTPKGKRRQIKPPKFEVPTEILKQVASGVPTEAFAFKFLDKNTLYRYNARDVWSTREYCKVVEPKLMADPYVSRAWNLIVKDANKAVRWMEYWGIAVNRQAVINFSQYCTQKEAEAYKRLMTYGNFNPSSNKQLTDLLYNKLKLPKVKETKSGNASSDREALDELAALKNPHPIIADLIDYRKFNKLNSTYASGMLRHIRADGRIHPSFLLDGATSGRLSCQAPNLQNVPRANASIEGKMLRDCFIAPPGYLLMEKDFSQLELRIAAMLSEDKNMIDDFAKGIDIHRNNARECCFIWGLTKDKWDKMTEEEQDPYRSRIKTTTFGKLYGKTDKGLAEEFGCAVKQVKQINEQIWGKYQRLNRWIEEQLKKGRKYGYVYTWWNGNWSRRRPLYLVGDADPGRRANAERSTWNTPIQGTAADFMTASLWPICNWILEEAVPAKMPCTVHDSILLEVKETVVDEVDREVERIMTGHFAKNVPIKVDTKIGKSWGSLTKYKRAA